MISRENMASILVANLFMISLAVGIGLNLGSLILVIFSFTALKAPKIVVDRDTKILFGVLCAYFFVFLLSIFLFGDRARILDRPSRTLLAIPVLFVLLRYPPKIRVVSIGIIVGAILSGISGLIYYIKFPQFNRAFQGLPESFGIWHAWSKSFMAIQSGDMAVSLGIFSLVGAMYYYRQRKYIFVFFALLGCMLGITASILSGTRGGWICIPVLLIVLIALNWKYIKFNFIISFFIAVCVASFIGGKPIYQKLQGGFQNINVDLLQYNKEKNTSAGIRIELWKDALYTFKGKPLLGVGITDRTKLRIEHKQKKLISVPDDFNDTHAHNQFLEAISVRGLLGLGALLSLFLWPLWVFLKRLRFAKSHLEKEASIRQETVCQLGICHILLVMGYCLTQSWFEHNSGIVFYSIVLVVFFAMSSGDKGKILK